MDFEKEIEPILTRGDGGPGEFCGSGKLKKYLVNICSLPHG